MNKKLPELWPILTSFNNLLAAFKNAARGKRSKPEIAGFEFDLEPNLFEIQNELRNDLYEPGKYHSFYIHDPKND